MRESDARSAWTYERSAAAFCTVQNEGEQSPELPVSLEQNRCVVAAAHAFAKVGVVIGSSTCHLAIFHAFIHHGCPSRAFGGPNFARNRGRLTRCTTRKSPAGAG